jgi:hypothetical protein
MHLGAGIALIITGSTLACVAMFVLWRRVASSIAVGLVAFAGAVVGTGALLVQEDVGAASWVVTLVAFVVLTPVHTRLVFGPAGPSGGMMVAAGRSAA